MRTDCGCCGASDRNADFLESEQSDADAEYKLPSAKNGDPLVTSIGIVSPPASKEQRDRIVSPPASKEQRDRIVSPPVSKEQGDLERDLDKATTTPAAVQASAEKQEVQAVDESIIAEEPIDFGLPKPTQMEEPEPKDEPPAGCCKRCWRRFQQQEPPRNSIPFWWFGPMAQTCCACCCIALFVVIGVILVAASSSVIETSVSYKFPDISKSFTVAEKMEGPVLMWYEVPSVVLNHKKYIENKDNFVWKPFLMKNYCTDAETQLEVRNRRIDSESKLRAGVQGLLPPDRFSELFNNSAIPTKVFRPCGLNSIAAFTDEYSLQKADGTQIVLDESDIVLKKDEDIYKDKIVRAPVGSAWHYTVDNERSWLGGGYFLDHFKVWMRSPAAPKAIHLWATIKDGLDAGTYVLSFTRNSAIWTSSDTWGVDDKRVIFSTSKTFGSKGACQFLGITCLVFAGLEALAAIMFIAGVLKKPKDE